MFLRIYQLAFILASIVVRVLLWPWKRVRKRIQLEKTTISPPIDKTPILIVHISSVGELEQALPIITQALNRRDNSGVQILFTSTSVMSRIIGLSEQFPKSIEYRLLPLLSWPWKRPLHKWVRAPLAIMVRYDFFPHLLVSMRHLRLVLISASLKGKFHKLDNNPLYRWYWRSILRNFSLIFCVTHKEQSYIDGLFNQKMRPKTHVFEFRVGQIVSRLNKAQESLAKYRWSDQLKSFYQDPSLILGSAWIQDISILNSPAIIQQIKQRKLKVLIVPHILSCENIKQIKSELNDIFSPMPIGTITPATLDFPDGPINILAISGILCELYSLFDHMYVGGGFGRSVHSLMEAFLSSGHVYCGPRVHRSTEYDFIMEISPKYVHKLDHFSDFAEIFTLLVKIGGNAITMEENTKKVIEHYIKQESTLLKSLGL